MSATATELQTLQTTTEYAPTSTSYLATGISASPQVSLPLRFTLVDADDSTNTTATTTLSLPIKNDDILEVGGTVKVTLRPDSPANTNYKVHRLNNNATLSVTDDDVPEFKIRAGRAVVESPDATADFIVSTEANLNRKVTVKYNLAETANFIAPGDRGTNKSAVLNFTNGAKEATLSINVVSDFNRENSGHIILTLITDSSGSSRYTVAASPNNSARVPVFDDDLSITFSVVADSGEVPESSATVKFKMTATGITQNRTLGPISATLSEAGGDFVHNGFQGRAYDYMVDFSDPDGDNIYTGDLIIRSLVQNDGTAEPDANVKLTINHSFFYNRGNTEGFLRILDDDRLPVVSIKADHGEIAENEGPPTFKLSATGIFVNKTLAIKATPRDQRGQFICR